MSNKRHFAVDSLKPGFPSLRTLFVVLTLASPSAYAFDFSPQTLADDLSYGIDALNFDGQVVEEKDAFYYYYLPIAVSMRDITGLYHKVLGQSPKEEGLGMQINGLPLGPVPKKSDYNFEINTKGSMRLNLEYRF